MRLHCEAKQQWDSESYAAHARFVSDLAEPVVQLLAPRAGERILDLGCGNGTLTEKLARTGAILVGADSSPEMLKAARALGLEVYLMDGQNIAKNLAFDEPFDAVFSNAALHWMPAIDRVLNGVNSILKPRGRFVGEFGGHGNIAAIRVALQAVLVRYGVDSEDSGIWYFPTVEEFSQKLEAHAFAIEHIELTPRPTLLPTGMETWLKTLANAIIKLVPNEVQPKVLTEVVDMLRPVLQDKSGNWTADYVRLRFRATLKD
jgi:SAM-dependent methyltransferase